MKLKHLTLAAVAFAVTAFAHGQTDPYLFGLRAKLPSTEKLKDPRIATLFEVWKTDGGALQSGGYLEMGFHFAESTHNMVLNVRSVAQMSDANGVLLLRGKGTLKDSTTNQTRECYVEWYGVDRRKQNQTTDAHDSFAIHFWIPGTDLNVSSQWEFPGFHQVEIYRPNI